MYPVEQREVACHYCGNVLEARSWEVTMWLPTKLVYWRWDVREPGSWYTSAARPRCLGNNWGSRDGYGRLEAGSHHWYVQEIVGGLVARVGSMGSRVYDLFASFASVCIGISKGDSICTVTVARIGWDERGVATRFRV
jgi:hypothetical protein